ncbi:DoxX family protein [Rathayibacter sp. VKM Ac-2760]|uniref:DoxX family membrane protein n=1 Tax=Rathayibacter sp. VKM Ac-2760 TaxID=2609253 RepID=UPI001ABE2A19|nr:DoxX family protein [Rathayibacter sp. VKM Ac-2760]
MSTRRPTRAAAIVVTAARVALGLLWLNEGLLKYRAGFGAADIRLVAESAAGNGRVPGFYQWFVTTVLGPGADLFGIVMPLLECSLGVALILGILTVPAALMSTVTLMMYWLADQLIGEYPVMVLLSVALVAVPAFASRVSLTGVADQLRRRRNPAAAPIPAALRPWL